jgi:hypothetical protein
VTPIGIELRNNNGTLVVELSLTRAQCHRLHTFVESKDELNFPPRGLTQVSTTERIALALEYTYPRTDQSGQHDITRIRAAIALANNAGELGLSLVVTRGFEFNLGPIHLGRRYLECEYISPEGELHKVSSNG